MASDDTQWVEDVRRWVASQGRSSVQTDSAELGYEAADPMVQARYWPDAAAPVGPSDASRGA